MNRRNLLAGAASLWVTGHIITFEAAASDGWNELAEEFRGSYRVVLGEFNDAETRAKAIAHMKPFCDRNGFAIICDETNNTPDIVDSHKFVMTFGKGNVTRIYTMQWVEHSVDFAEING